MTDFKSQPEPANDYHTRGPRWRLPVMVIGAIIGMVGWVVIGWIR